MSVLNLVGRSTLAQRLVFAMGAIFLAVTLTAATTQAATVTNTNFGDGFVTASEPGCLLAHGCSVTITGSNNSTSNNYTLYSDVVASTGYYGFLWSYSTQDTDGAAWDPAGYVVNGVYTYLVSTGYTASGSISLLLNAGDTFGFFIHSLDGIFGRGQINVVATPVPASIVFLGTGLLGLLAIGRRRKRNPVS